MPESPNALVREFHETFSLPTRILPDLYIPERIMRRDILVEETQEYVDALESEDLVELADALADIVYVAYGNALSHGISLDDVIAEVHRSNMSKLGEDGKPIYREDGKVLKGPNYFKPDIERYM